MCVYDELKIQTINASKQHVIKGCILMEHQNYQVTYQFVVIRKQFHTFFTLRTHLFVKCVEFSHVMFLSKVKNKVCIAENCNINFKVMYMKDIFKIFFCLAIKY